MGLDVQFASWMRLGKLSGSHPGGAQVRCRMLMKVFSR